MGEHNGARSVRADRVEIQLSGGDGAADTVDGGVGDRGAHPNGGRSTLTTLGVERLGSVVGIGRDGNAMAARTRLIDHQGDGGKRTPGAGGVVAADGNDV